MLKALEEKLIENREIRFQKYKQILAHLSSRVY